MLRNIAQSIADSAPHDWAIALLRNVSGLPPIMQAIHIISVAAIVASILFIHLRVLGVAYPSRSPQRMVQRMMPWTWWALPVLLISGLPFILARPFRYFVNPVFGIKVAAIVLVLLLTTVFVKYIKKIPAEQALPPALKLLSIFSLALWLLIMFAGRWIAYADYLFPPV